MPLCRFDIRCLRLKRAKVVWLFGEVYQQLLICTNKKVFRQINSLSVTQER